MVALSIDTFRDGKLLNQSRFDSATHKIIKIGRLGSAHVQLSDPAVSRVHAVIELTADAATLIDMGSTAGTCLNGSRVNKTALSNGDQITIGGLTLAVGTGQATAAAPPMSGAAVAGVPPQMPQAPQMPQMPQAPQMPQMPQMPQAPQMPQVQAPAPLAPAAPAPAPTWHAPTPTPQPAVPPQPPMQQPGYPQQGAWQSPTPAAAPPTWQAPAQPAPMQQAPGNQGPAQVSPAPAPAPTGHAPAQPAPMQQPVASQPMTQAPAAPAGFSPSPYLNNLVEKMAQLPEGNLPQVELLVDSLLLGEVPANNYGDMDRRNTDDLLGEIRRQNRHRRMWTIAIATGLGTLLIGALLALPESDEQTEEAANDAESAAARSGEAGKAGEGADGKPGEAGTPSEKPKTAFDAAEDRDEERYVYLTLSEASSLSQLAEANLIDPGQADQLLQANSAAESVEQSLEAGTEVRLPKFMEHTIESGQTLGVVAKDYLDDAGRYNEIFELNRDVMPDPGAVEVGMKIKIPFLK